MHPGLHNYNGERTSNLHILHLLFSEEDEIVVEDEVSPTHSIKMPKKKYIHQNEIIKSKSTPKNDL